MDISPGRCWVMRHEATGTGQSVGGRANAQYSGVAAGYYANGSLTNVAVGYYANAQGGSERIAIGHLVTNTVDNSAADSRQPLPGWCNQCHGAFDLRKWRVDPVDRTITAGDFKSDGIGSHDRRPEHGRSKHQRCGQQHCFYRGRSYHR